MRKAYAPQQFTPQEFENLPTVNTATAAQMLLRTQQTLRGWACHENGPILPIRINGRLHWKTEDLRRLLLGA